MITRRQILVMTPIAGVGVMVGRGRVKAATQAVLEIGTPNTLLGAIVAGVGADRVRVKVDPRLSPTEIRVGDSAPVSITERIMLKGSGAGRARFLDDGRNATRVGANVRRALIAAAPAQESIFLAQHRAWARPLARAVLDWTHALEASSVAGKRVRDDHGRQYLLEWAGAEVAPGGLEGPTTLARLPRALDEATPQAYRAYLAALVRALV